MAINRGTRFESISYIHEVYILKINQILTLYLKALSLFLEDTTNTKYFPMRCVIRSL